MMPKAMGGHVVPSRMCHDLVSDALWFLYGQSYIYYVLILSNPITLTMILSHFLSRSSYGVAYGVDKTMT